MATDHELVKASYGRCCLAPGFFDSFYATFVASSPVVRDKFRKTDMARQKGLLREGITFMILFAGGSAMAAGKIKALGESHAKTRLDIAPALYPLWIDSLLIAVAKHDPQHTKEMDDAWRRTMAKGIGVMQSMYESKPAK